MSAERNSVSCSQCDTPIEHFQGTTVMARMPCSSCGSTARTFNVHVEDTLVLREKIGLKQKRQGHSRPIYESGTGDDLHRKSGEWNHLTREIDRENNRYREIIIKPTSGEVILTVDEPLTEHIGRGSAKPKGNLPRGDP